MTLYLDNRADGQSLWSDRFERALSNEAGLREEIAANAAYIIGCGLKRRAQAQSRPSIQAFMIYVELCGHSTWDDYFNTLLAVAQRLTTLAPDDACGHGLVVVANSEMAAGRSTFNKSEIEAHAVAAKTAAARALELDPQSAYARLALAILAPGPQYWLELEAIADRTGGYHMMQPLLQVSPLRQSGRLREALHVQARVVAGAPLSASARTLQAVLHMQTGNPEAAARILEQAVQLWPDHVGARFYHFVNAVFYGEPETALTFLNNDAEKMQFGGCSPAMLARLYRSASAWRRSRRSPRASAQLRR